MIHEIQLRPEVEAQLAAEAQARGLTLDRYITEKLAEPRYAFRADKPSIAEAIDNIRVLRKGNRMDGLKIKDLIEEGRRY